MPNITWEQNLVDDFVNILRGVGDCSLSIKNVLNKNCRDNEKFADVEFIAKSGQRWAIEAKYGAPNNISNEKHKLFGNLLFETRHCHLQDRNVGLLLHRETECEFRQHVRLIPRKTFCQFGNLIPVRAVFVFSTTELKRKTWMEFYDGDAGRPVE